MNTRRIGAVCCVFILATTAWAQTPQSSDLPFSPSSITTPQPPNAVELLLSKQIESVDWVENTLEEAFDWMRSQADYGVNIIPRWNNLGTEGVTLDSPITLKLNNTSISDVLNEIIMQVSSSGQVTYHGIGNKLIISTKADFDRTMITRVYDVTDLLLRIPDFGESAPAIDMQNSQQTGQGGGQAQSIFQGGQGGQEQSRGGEQAERELEERLNTLRDMIEQSIEPTSWNIAAGGGGGGAPVAGVGGGQGTIRAYRNSLIITNTVEVHEKIAGDFYLKKRRR